VPLSPSTVTRSAGQLVRSSLAGGVLTIDLDAIVHNYELFRRGVGRASCAAVVKADAYGLGVSRVASRLFDAGCREFFVATVDEALALRVAIDGFARIYVLCAPVAEALPTLASLGIIPVLNSAEDLAAAHEFASRLHEPFAIAIHLDTGLSRLGLTSDDLSRFRNAQSPANLRVELVLSHLANAGVQSDPLNADQLKAFERMTQRFPGIRRSLAASSGAFLGAAYRFELVRPGAALYGVNPVPALVNPMRPVVRLRGRVTQLRSIPAGTGVGYGPLFTPSRNSRIATVALGYADGLLRTAANKGAMWFGTHRLPIVGAISMDCVTLDATDAADDRLRPGAYVDLIGPRQSVDDLATTLGTIGYEVLTALGRRYDREYVAAVATFRPSA
jgi:alanine racemase